MKTALASLLLLSNSKLALNLCLDLRRAMVYIAVLRIMQAFTEVSRYCCVTLLVPHLLLLPRFKRGALCCLAFLRLPLFSFQGAEPALRPEQNTQNRF